MLAAKAQGLKRYFTGRACPAGHIAERFVSMRCCVVCSNQRAAARKVANHERVKAQKRAWVAANPERVKALKAASQKRNRAAATARSRKYREANLEKTRAATALWMRNNPGKVNARAARRRAAVIQRTPSWADHDAIAGMYELAAAFRRTGMQVEVDHAIPLRGRIVSGLHIAENLQLINSTANKAKANAFATF